MDDLIPVDAQGTPLLPRSSIGGELWPLLLSKAICKMLQCNYEVRLDTPEFGEASILSMLTGWLPEAVSLNSDRLVC